MRLVVILALVIAPRVASADKRCFVGTQVIDDGTKANTLREVTVIDPDPAKSELHYRTWKQYDPDDAHDHVYTVDGAHHTFTAEHDTGTFEGPPFQWTAWKSESVVHEMRVVAEGTIATDTLSVAIHVWTHGKPSGTARVDGKRFDCGELARRVAALDDTAHEAHRYCYAGTESSLVSKDREPVVFEQIIEPRRVRLLRWSHDQSNVQIFTVDGSSITVTTPVHPSFVQSGTIVGPAGAWTSYKASDADLQAEGTLGGRTMTRKLVVHTAHLTSTGELDADAFDCKDLAKRRDALKTTRSP